ncbi:TIGR02206 family membrane protein [Corynebacterium nasicanis]
MRPYSPEHLAVLVTGVLACGVLVVAARRVAGTPWEVRARQITGWVLMVLAGAWLVFTLWPGNLHITEGLPFHLCDWLRYITAYGLISGDERAWAVTYYWGILLNPQAIVTPYLPYVHSPAWVQFAGYWFFHLVALIVPLVMVFGFGWRPTWKDFRFVASVSPAWMAVAMTANKVTGGNYGFFSHRPPTPSIIDLFYRWGMKRHYWILEVSLIALVWTGVMTWPWERARR